MKNKVIVVVDMQNDFVSGVLGSEDPKSAVSKIRNLLDKFTYPDPYCLDKKHIVFTQDTHNEYYLSTHEGKLLPIVHCVKNTPGWCIVDELFQYAGHRIIEKSGFGCVTWRQYFDDVFTPDEITIVGVCTDICVVSNALILRALYRNADIKVIADCCAGTTKEKHDAALKVMESCQIEIIYRE